MRSILLLTFLAISIACLTACSKTKDNGGFPEGIDPTASLEGKWRSVAYDFTLTNGVTSKLDSAFSFTGPILEETYKANGERIRTFLGFSRNYTYSRVDNKLYFIINSDTIEATIHTLQSGHFAYTIQRSFVLNDTIRHQYTSAQLTR